MTADEYAWSKALREPFPAEQVGKLPRVTCGDCSRDKQRKVCDRHSKVQCNTCHNYLTTAHIHLDYVGHAAVTARLLEVDPEWTWEPVAWDERGLPVGNPRDGMWIKLTVKGVTRLGFGTTDRNDVDAVKILIGDALRNAAMRFGVAIDLWSKEDIKAGYNDAEHGAGGQQDAPRNEAPKPSNRDWLAEAASVTDLQKLVQLGFEANAFGEMVGPVKDGLLKRRSELEAAAVAAAQDQAAEAPQAPPANGNGRRAAKK